MKYKERLKLILQSLTLLLGSCQIAELRVPKSDRGPLTGLFDDLDKMAEVAAELSSKVPGIYFCLNPITESMVDRVTNDVRKNRSAVKDADIARRKWLPIDFDPFRPAGIPSTDLEHKAALAKARACLKWLRDLGWSTALLSDSGNGAHLLYAIDLPNDEASTDLIRSCIEVISMMFSDGNIQVDTQNFNAARVWRAYGTFNCKGEATDDRPHRRARLLEVPAELETVSVVQLNELVTASPLTRKVSGTEQLDVAGWVAENRVPVVGDGPWTKGSHKWILQCPWNESHTNKSAYIVQFANGGIAAGCLHKSCAGRNWPDLRVQFEPTIGTSAGLELARQPEKLSRASKTQTTVLLEMAQDVKLFSTPQGESYARVPVGNHGENHRVRGNFKRAFLPDDKLFKRLWPISRR